MAWWDFNASQRIPSDEEEDEEDWGRTTWEKISGTEYSVEGLAAFVPGVQGSAIKFDGFSSYVEGSPFPEESEEWEEEFEFPDAISVEAWVSLGAYPWNWAPILTIGKYKITGFYFGVDSRGCPGFHMSDATSVWHECNAPVNPETKAGMDLKKWYHLVGTYDPEEGLSIYVNGELKSTYNVPVRLRDRLQPDRGGIQDGHEQGGSAPDRSHPGLGHLSLQVYTGRDRG
jgi:hypothetical protein